MFEPHFALAALVPATGYFVAVVFSHATMTDGWNAAVFWIVVSTWVPCLLGFCQGWMRHLYWACTAIAWRKVCSTFCLRSEDLCQTSSVAVLARILAECGFGTGYVISQHEANAQADDALLFGIVQLPCHSLTLKVLSALQVTHYILLHEKGQEGHVVGPMSTISAFKKCA